MMKELLHGLSIMFFELKIVDSTNNENPILVFAVACAIIGAIAVILDFLLFYLRGSSLLKLKHGKNTFFFLFAWSIGALIIGWIGQMANIFVVSISSSVIVGFTWPVIFTKLLEIKAEDENSNEEEQKFSEEE